MCVLKNFFITVFAFLLVFSHASPAYKSSAEPNPEVLYSECFSSGEKAQVKGDFEKSLEFFEQSLTLARNIKSSEKELDSLGKIALLLWNKGEYEQSTQKYNEALSLAKKNKDPIRQNQLETIITIQDLYSKGTEQRNSEAYQESIETLEKAVALCRENGLKEHELKCLRYLSLSYYDTNRILDFKKLNEQSLEIAKKINHKKEIGKCSNNIGIYHMKYKNYSQALLFYEESLNIAKEFNNKIEVANCSNNIGIIYKNIGIYDKALDYLNQALAIDRELGDELYIAVDLNGIGTVYRNMGLSNEKKEYFEKAIDNYNECLGLFRKMEDLKKEVYVLNNLGSVYSDLHEYFGKQDYFQLSYTTFEEALKKAEILKDNESMGMILNNIGIIHSNKGNFDESTKYFQEAIDLALKIEGGKILWESYLELAQVYRKQKRIKEAREYFNRSISIIEDIRSNIKLEELKASFLGTNKRMEAYHGLIHILFT